MKNNFLPAQNRKRLKIFGSPFLGLLYIIIVPFALIISVVFFLIQTIIKGISSVKHHSTLDYVK